MVVPLVHKQLEHVIPVMLVNSSTMVVANPAHQILFQQEEQSFLALTVLVVLHAIVLMECV